MVALSGIFYTFKETFSRYSDQLFCFLADPADTVGTRGIGMIALVDYSRIQADDIPLPDKPVGAWDPMDHFVID